MSPSLRTRSLKATVLVIHENRGLNDHIADVARRLALAGYRAVAPDLLSPAGGTPAERGCGARRDRQARPRQVASRTRSRCSTELAQLAAERRQGRRGRLLLGRRVRRTGSRSPPAASSTPASPITAPLPTRPKRAKVAAPLLLHYAGLDDRVERDRRARGSRRCSAPARGRTLHLSEASTTPSTTTRRPSATTRPPPTSPGSARWPSSDGTWLVASPSKAEDKEKARRSAPRAFFLSVPPRALAAVAHEAAAGTGTC